MRENMEHGSPEQVEGEETKELNILDGFEATMDAFENMEGSGWADAQKKLMGEELKLEPNETEYSKYNYKVRGALAYIRDIAGPKMEAMRADVQNAKSDDERRECEQALSQFIQTHIFEIYGDGGYNRYWVRPDGKVEFSKMHALRFTGIEKAEKLGFKTF